jgi:hypothetical protein
MKAEIRYKVSRNKHFNYWFIVVVTLLVIVLGVGLYWMHSAMNISESIITGTVDKAQIKEAVTETKSVEDSSVSEEALAPIHATQTYVVFLPDYESPYLKRRVVSGQRTEEPIKKVETLLDSLKSFSGGRLFDVSPVRSVFFYNQRLVLDLNAELLPQFQDSDMRSIQTLYAIVNSLLSNLPQEEVYILFGGEVPSVLDTGFDFSQPLRQNMNLVRKPEKNDE